MLNVECLDEKARTHCYEEAEQTKVRSERVRSERVDDGGGEAGMLL